MFSVYKHTSPSGKVYIGITSQKPGYRWKKNGKGYSNNQHFWRAIQKYGWDNFKHEILFTGITKEEARKIEIELIEKYKSIDGNYGYNNSTGGGGFNGIKLTEEQKKHLSDIKKGKNPHIWTDDMRKKLSESIKGHPSYTKGMKMSEESSLKKSKSLKGHKGCEYNKIHYSKAVIQYDKDMNIVNRFYSQKEATRVTGINESSIHYCCEGKRISAGGYIWKYEERKKNNDLE